MTKKVPLTLDQLLSEWGSSTNTWIGDWNISRKSKAEAKEKFRHADPDCQGTVAEQVNQEVLVEDSNSGAYGLTLTLTCQECQAQEVYQALDADFWGGLCH